MAQFITRCVLELKDKDDDGQWLVVAPLIYQSDVANRTFTVPVGASAGTGDCRPR